MAQALAFRAFGAGEPEFSHSRYARAVPLLFNFINKYGVFKFGRANARFLV